MFLLITMFVFAIAVLAEQLENKSRQDIEKTKKCLAKAVKVTSNNCNANPNAPICEDIRNNESQLQEVLTALDAYCGGSDFLNHKAVCVTSTDKAEKGRLAANLKQALDNLNHNTGGIRLYCERNFSVMFP